MPEEGADLRAGVDLREGGGLRHGQVRQEARQGQLTPELRDALPHRDGVSVQVRQTSKADRLLNRTTPPSLSLVAPLLLPLFLASS